MFGLFKNNDTPEQDNSQKNELIQRWDGFLAKIEARFNESLQHAEAACLEQLEDTDYDYYTVIRSWSAMKAQIFNIIKKIDTTWQDKVEPQMREIGDFWIDQSFKAGALNDKLHYQLQRYQTILEGKLSQKYYNHAIQIANQNFQCTQCHAELQIKKDLFRAQYVSCGYCQAVNTFEPETKFAQIGWNIIDNMVALECLPLYDNMQQSIQAIHDAKAAKNTDSDSLWSAYKNAYFTYYDTFFKKRIALKSDEAERYDDDMKRKQREYTDYENTQRYNKH